MKCVSVGGETEEVANKGNPRVFESAVSAHKADGGISEITGEPARSATVDRAALFLAGANVYV